jgi:hypothetical protein
VHPKFAPEISPLAFDGDELVGVLLAFDFPDLSEGWIGQLATRASHRRRGIGQALLRTTFGWLFERGRRVAGVSTDTRTGALGLYEKVGMRVQRQYTRYTKRLGWRWIIVGTTPSGAADDGEDRDGTGLARPVGRALQGRDPRPLPRRSKGSPMESSTLVPGRRNGRHERCPSHGR